MSQAEVVLFIGKGIDGDTVDLKCPKCYFSRSFPLKKLESFRGLINVKCKCGDVFSVKLEYREKQRKKLQLEGLYCGLSWVETEKWKIYLQDLTRTNCTVVDLSVSGVAITSHHGHSVEKGDKLRLRFELDKGISPVLELDVLVCNVKGNTLGCSFLDSDKYHKKIGIYLL